MRPLLFCVFILTGACLPAGLSRAAEDLLIADFEGKDYGDWIVEGDAFGSGPAEGTLPGQMHVGGYQGKRLVNSFFKGDRATGRLSSPPLKIERDFLTFLIGGGGHKGKTCINLVHEGKVVRTAEGPNREPGGSEELAPCFWNVKEFKGRTATIQIVDKASGGWGHINIDQIVQSDQKPKSPEYRQQEKEFTVEKKYLAIPIKNSATAVELSLEVDGKPVRRYETELATDPKEVDWYAFFTIESYQGKTARVSVTRAAAEAFGLVRQTDRVPESESWYTENLRPRFHFSQKVGWNNDPNGMVYLDGEWHLFFQHNPVGWKWGNMTWGHAVSKDLVHWEQLPNALFPRTMARGACFSGGATVDGKNTSGWKTGDNDVLVAFLTDTGAGESVAYSNDNGRSFTWYEGNPVVRHKGRDPKVIWYNYDAKDAPLDDRARRLGGHWVMFVYDEHRENKQNVAFYTSTDLKKWTEQSHLPGYFECPELFELPIEKNENDTRWVVFSADARYAIGDFDGKKFTPEHEGKRRVHYGPYYASQTFENSPDGRRIQIGWVKLKMPGMPFNQAFSFPHELTLHRTSEGVRMYAKPISEIKKLHKNKSAIGARALRADTPVKVDVSGELAHVRATFDLGAARRVGLDIGGNVVAYDAKARTLNGAPMTPNDGRISIQVLVDRPMIEICGNEGAVFITAKRNHKGHIGSVKAFADGEGGKLIRLEVYELESIWKD